MVVGLALAAASVAYAPRLTPPAFVTEQYGLTFRIPQGSYYCALPDDWVGADHGTVIFLKPPKQCRGAGYPSSGRGFDGDPPRIEVFYAYDIGDQENDQVRPRCKSVGQAVFLGRTRQLCETSHRHKIAIAVFAKYRSDSPAQTTLTLETSPGRLQDDLRKFRGLLQSAKTCTATWRDDKGGKPFTTGSGAPCPDDARWF
jgi:hypothetical protein